MQANPSLTWTHRAETFGALLKRTRTARGLTQRQIAQAAEMTYAEYITEIEKGRRKPSRAQLDRICAVLGFDRDDVHAMLGLIPLDVEDEWINNTSFRTQVRILAGTQEG